MSKDVKLIQRGMNVQANDLAVPPGTMLAADNVDLSRDGVAATRLGHDGFYTGLPWYAIDATESLDSNASQSLLGPVRGAWSVFNDSYAIHLNNGLPFIYDSISSSWQSLPVELSHQIAFIGSVGSSYLWRIGRMLIAAHSQPVMGWQLASTLANVVGMAGSVANDAANAAAGTRFRTAFDAVTIGANIYVSDDTTIRSAAVTTLSSVSVLAGSITASGYTDATGTSARFSGASWLATDGTSLFVADNTNAIRKITTAGVVTTLAGSITAGDSDGAGAGARFRTISGMTYTNGFLYVTESAGHRIRKVDVSTGSVTIFAGSLTATSGHVNGVGTAARFNTPNGVEFIGDSLFVGDTGNNYVRRAVVSSASVTDFAGSGSSNSDGMVAGDPSTALMPSVTVRGQYNSASVGSLTGQYYLSVECVGANSSIDLGLVTVPRNVTTILTQNTTRDRIFHYGRCPNVYPAQTSGPNKLDVWGVNVIRGQDSRVIEMSTGVVLSTSVKPRILDAFTRVNSTDAQPRLRDLGVDWPEAPSVTTTSGNTFANNTTWAYRTLCGLKLSTGRLVLGAPSERVIATNTSGGNVDGSVTAYAAPDLPYDGLPFIQVYRTKTFASSLDPGDDMYLCYEAAVSYGVGSVFTDSLPDALLGAALYTNNTQFQAAAASLPPPAFANDAAEFMGRLVVGNYVPQSSSRIKVLGTSPLVSGTSSITFATNVGGSSAWSFTLTCGTTTSTNTNVFGIGTGGSAAVNAVTTARNIAYVINRSPDAWMLRAMYDENDPGAVVVYSMHPGVTRHDTVAHVTSSRTQVELVFSTNAATAFAQINSNAKAIRQGNALAWSDIGDPDSFPAVNSRTVGSLAEQIVRLLPQAELLLCVKNKSIRRLDADFDEQIYDLALKCTKPNSFARIDNQWIGLFTRGFVALTSSQPVPVGRPIDRAVSGQIGARASPTFSGNVEFASAAALDKQGLYICRFNQKTFVYNARTKAWSSLSFLTPDAPGYWGVFGDSFLCSFVYQPRAMLRQMEQTAYFNTLSTAGFQYAYRDMVLYGTLSGSTWTPDTSLGPCDFRIDASALVGAIVETTRTQRVETASGAGPYTLAFSGSVADGSVGLLLPIRVRALYAPTAAPGSNAAFTQILTTVEFSRTGSLTANFYGRNDVGSNASGSNHYLVVPTGDYKTGFGVSRTVQLAMPTSSFEGVDLVYESPQRFETPADRAIDQQLFVELVSQTAMQPLAIKAVTVDIQPTDNSKVRR